MVNALQMDISTAGDEGLLFDWKLDVERLERETRLAVQRRQPNDWALVEAECSLDLIVAELKAAQGRSERTEGVTRTIEHLKSWQLRVDRVIRQLRQLSRS